MNQTLEKRLKSLAWRAGMMTLAFFLAYVADNLGQLDLDPGMVTIAGLVLGELSKHINNQYR